MKAFFNFLSFEAKRSMTKRNRALLGLFLILCIYLVFTGTSQYKNILKNKTEFQEIEKLKALNWNTYTQYGGYGIYLYFVPSRLSVLVSNVSIFTELTAHVDVGERANIHNTLKGKDAFAQKSGKLWDFAGIILLLGSFMSLYFGYDCLRSREYLKFLTSLFGHRRVFVFIVLSRMLLLCSYFVLLTFAVVLAVLTHGIFFSGSEWLHILYFLVTMLLMVIFFFTVGTIMGSIKRTRIARFLLVVIWVGSVYFIPSLVNWGIEIYADSIKSNYKSELEKISVMMDFETAVKKKVGEILASQKSEDEKKREIEELRKNSGYSYLENEFVKIQEFERQTENAMEHRIEVFQLLSTLFPSAFYISTSYEISSRGLNNILEFHRYTKDVKDRFMKFYVEKKFPEKKESVESFVKENENIFNGNSNLPGFFGLGILITVFWIASILRLSFWFYKKSLFSVSKVEGVDELEVRLIPGESIVVLSRGKPLSEHLFNVFAGQNQYFKGNIYYGQKDSDINLVIENKEICFTFLIQPGEIPGDIRIGNFVTFFKKVLTPDETAWKEFEDTANLRELRKRYFSDLNSDEKGLILSKVVSFRKCSILMVYDFAKGMDPDNRSEFIRLLNDIKKQGCAILYFTNDAFLGRRVGDYISYLKSDAPLMAFKV